jgi:hypothetical protein
MTEDVLVRRQGGVGHVSLNRPKALHALTQAMCEAISAALLEWRKDHGIELVLIDHAEGRGFCAGGDVAMVRRSALENGGAAGRAFFHAEYRMNHLLFTYPKPTVVFGISSLPATITLPLADVSGDAGSSTMWKLGEDFSFWLTSQGFWALPLATCAWTGAAMSNADNAMVTKRAIVPPCSPAQ